MIFKSDIHHAVYDFLFTISQSVPAIDHTLLFRRQVHGIAIDIKKLSKCYAESIAEHRDGRDGRYRLARIEVLYRVP